MRILIVRLSALGDIVHALPVLAALRRAMPSCSIDWVVEEAYAPILALADGLQRRIIVRAATTRVSDSNPRFAGGFGYVRAAMFMRRQKYDVALDLQGLLKSAAWARLSGAKRVIGFDREHLREPRAALMYSETVVPGSGPHVIDKNLSVLSALGIDQPATEVRLRPSSTSGIRAAIDGAGGSRQYVVLNPGAAWPNKRWPAERFGALASRLRDATGMRSLITWGPSEQELAAAIVAASSGAASLAPPTSVEDLAAIVGEAALVVAGDTGPLHIAAAQGAPLVGLYGPTRPERNGPWNPDDEVISRAATCICYHKRQCLRGDPCINEIALDEVFAAALRRLAKDSHQ